MKLELPLAVLLLAGGLIAWKSLKPSNWSSNFAPRSQTAQVASTLTGDRLTASDNRDLQPIDAKTLLSQTLIGLRYAPPLHAKIDLAIEMFGETFEMQGDYLQAGEGTPLAKLEIDCGTDDCPFNVTQIFDGRFYYVLESSGQEKSLKFADLYEVTTIGAPKIDCIAGLKGWFGTGGVVPLLEQLLGSFDFEIVRDTTATLADGSSMRLITTRGEWRTDSLHQLLRDQIQFSWLEPEIKWDRLPRQIPHQVEVTIGIDGRLPNFPYKIVFFQMEPDRGKAKWKPKPVFAVSARELSKLDSIDKSSFQISAEGIMSQDLTEDYLARIKMFLYQPIKK